MADAELVEAAMARYINDTLAVNRVRDLRLILDDLLPRDLAASPTTMENQHETSQVFALGKIVSVSIHDCCF
jgi:hypothetical protein